MKKAVFIIAPEFFRDEELFKTAAVLEREDIKTSIASTHKGICHGKLGAKAEADLSLSEVNSEHFDAIIYVGGDGASEFFHNAEALDLAIDFYHDHKVVAAICIAPRILAEAGILSGRRATAFNTQAEPLKRLGVNFTGRDVEIDDNIITADGPDAAEEFGIAIADKLEDIHE